MHSRPRIVCGSFLGPAVILEPVSPDLELEGPEENTDIYLSDSRRVSLIEPDTDGAVGIPLTRNCGDNTYAERFSPIITWRLHHVHGRSVDVPSPLDYESPKKQSILNEDEVIAALTLDTCRSMRSSSVSVAEI